MFRSCACRVAIVSNTMKTTSIAAAALTIWLGLGVVLKNGGRVDAFVLNHRHRSRMLLRSSLFLKRTPSTTSSTSRSTGATLEEQQNTIIPEDCRLEWKVYVDQSEASLDKGGSATLDAFLGLAPAATVQVKPALLPMGSYYASPANYAASSGSSNNGGGNNNSNNNNNSVGPFVRCIPLRRERLSTTIEEEVADVDADDSDSRRAFDVCNVDSVDKVYRVLTRHMRVQGVTTTACDCLKWKYKANAFLESGQISLAIEAYDKALEIVTTSNSKTPQLDNNSDSTTSTATSSSTSYGSSSSSSSSSSSISSLKHQEGALYLMRATAYWQRARRLQKELKATMLKFSILVSSSSSTSSLSKSHQPVTATLLKTVAHLAALDVNAENNGQGKPREEEKEQPSLLSAFWGGGSKSSSTSSSSSSTTATNNAAATVAALQQAIFRRILRDAAAQEFQFRRTLYMHSLYQHALLQAAQDALYSTELLPDYPTAWQQAGDIYSDLWKLPESTLFYQRAIQLDNDDDGDDGEKGESSSLDASSSSSSSWRPQQQQRRRLETTLKPVIERLKRRQQLLDQARSYYGWSEDTLRLALDVAATSMKVDLKRP